MDSAIVLALIAIVATVVGGMFKLLADNTAAFNKVAESSEKVAIETRAVAEETRELRKESKDGNDKAEKRNGHLGEQNIQITQLITSQNKDLAVIREASQDNAATNLKVVQVLETTAITLKGNTERVLKATEEVAKNLKKSDQASQVIDQQTVVHQLVKNKE